MKFKIIVSIPPRSLWPNGRSHHFTKAKAAKKFREACQAAVLQAIENVNKPLWKSATVQSTWFFRNRGRRDPDNLIAALKYCYDGAVRAGLLIDDDQLTHLPPRMEIDRATPRVEVEFVNETS